MEAFEQKYLKFQYVNVNDLDDSSLNITMNKSVVGKKITPYTTQNSAKAKQQFQNPSNNSSVNKNVTASKPTGPTLNKSNSINRTASSSSLNNANKSQNQNSNSKSTGPSYPNSNNTSRAVSTSALNKNIITNQTQNFSHTGNLNNLKTTVTNNSTTKTVTSTNRTFQLKNTNTISTASMPAPPFSDKYAAPINNNSVFNESKNISFKYVLIISFISNFVPLKYHYTKGYMITYNTFSKKEGKVARKI